MSDMYERIKELAQENWNSRRSFRWLADQLDLNSPWHAGQQVKRAWDYFNRRGDTGACAAISRVFWSETNC